jgi:GTP-binding protein
VKINEELKLYNVKLEERPQIVAANKMDVPEAEEHLREFRKKLKEAGEDRRIFPISAATRQGVQELLYAAADMLDAIPAAPPVEELADLAERKVYRLEKNDDESFTIRRENDAFVVEGAAIERLAKRTDFNRYDSAVRFGNILRKMGIDDELRKRGAVDGQTIRIGELEFEFVEKE